MINDGIICQCLYKHTNDNDKNDLAPPHLKSGKLRLLGQRMTAIRRNRHGLAVRDSPWSTIHLMLLFPKGGRSIRASLLFRCIQFYGIFPFHNALTGIFFFIPDRLPLPPTPAWRTFHRYSLISSSEHLAAGLRAGRRSSVSCRSSAAAASGSTNSPDTKRLSALSLSHRRLRSLARTTSSVSISSLPRVR